MFSVGESSEDGTPELRLEEDSATLEAILPYLYPKSVPPLAVAFPFITNFVDACEKYQVGRFIQLVSYNADNFIIDRPWNRRSEGGVSVIFSISSFWLREI